MTKPTETKQALINLALAVADCLEDPSTPDSLRDALNDPVVNELTEALAPGLDCSIVLLRGLACLAKSRDGETKPEDETLTVTESHAKQMSYTMM